MICKFCGKSIPDDAVYCPECGLIIRSRYEVLSERFTPRDSLPHYSEETLKRMFERDEVERQAREHAFASHVPAEPEDDEARLDRMYEQARFLERFGAEREEAEQKALAEKAARLAAETDTETASSETDSTAPDSLESDEGKTKETAETDTEEAEAGIHAETAEETDIVEDIEVSAAANAGDAAQSPTEEQPEETCDTESIAETEEVPETADNTAAPAEADHKETLEDSESVEDEKSSEVTESKSGLEDHETSDTADTSTETEQVCTVDAAVPETKDVETIETTANTCSAETVEVSSDFDADNAETDETARNSEAVEAEKKTEKQAEAEANEMETDSAQDVDGSADISTERQEMQIDDEIEVDAEAGTEPDVQVTAEKETEPISSEPDDTESESVPDVSNQDAEPENRDNDLKTEDTAIIPEPEAAETVETIQKTDGSLTEKENSESITDSEAEAALGAKENVDAAPKTDASEKEEVETEEASVISIEEKRAERGKPEEEHSPEDLSTEEKDSDEDDADPDESVDDAESADTDIDTNADTDTDEAEAASEEDQSDEASEPQLSGKSKYTKIIAAVLVLVAVCAVALINLPAIRLRMARSAASKAMEQLNYADAITAYKKLLSLDPTDEAAYLSLTDAYLNTDHHGDAITLLRKGMKVLPDSTALKEEMDAINPSVEFSVPGGSFSDPVTVTLVTASDSNIRYSLSSNDHQGAEEDYTSPVEMNYSGTYTLKAHAVTPDGFACVENSETYVISLDPTKYHLNDWHETSKGWQYLDGSGKTVSGWLELDSKYYYLDEDGYRVTGMQTIDGDTYFFNKDGVMQTGWQESDGKRYFFDETGKMLKDVWIEDNYYVGDDGAMITNGTTPDGTYVDGNGAKSFNFAAEYAKHPNTMVLIYTKDRKDMGEYSDFPARVYHNHQGDTPTGDYFETTVHISDRAFLHYIDKNLPDALVTDAYRFLPQIGILNAKQDENGIVTEFDFILGSQA